MHQLQQKLIYAAVEVGVMDGRLHQLENYGYDYLYILKSTESHKGHYYKYISPQNICYICKV